MTKVKIKKITKTTVSTKYGDKQKYSVQCRSISKGKDFWADAWESKATKNWKEGQDVDVEVEPREYNGKTYYTIRPYEVSINEVYALLQEIRGIIGGQSYTIATNGNPAHVEMAPLDDAPPPTDDDIPF